jgi:hypothetical protein
MVRDRLDGLVLFVKAMDRLAAVNDSMVRVAIL